MTAYRDDHGGLASALAAGDHAAQVQQAFERRLGGLLRRAFDEACIAAGLPPGAFRCDHMRLDTVLQVQVCGDVYFPSPFANSKPLDVGEVEVTDREGWVVNDTDRCSDARAAVAALLRTAQAGSAIRVARRRYVSDVRQARANLASRQRWAFWSRVTIAVLLAVLPVAYFADALLILDVLLLMPAVWSLALAVDGIKYDEKIIEAHAHVKPDAG